MAVAANFLKCSFKYFAPKIGKTNYIKKSAYIVMIYCYDIIIENIAAL